MTPEERQAEALARWLDGPRDAPPPDLDPEIIEAVGALQPGRIPAARVTADEILASVREGPLAAPAEPAGGGGGAPRIALAHDALPTAANRPHGPRRRPWIPVVFGGGAAAALAAALALIVIVPTMFIYSATPPAEEVATAPLPIGERSSDDIPRFLSEPDLRQLPLGEPRPDLIRPRRSGDQGPMPAGASSATRSAPPPATASASAPAPATGSGRSQGPTDSATSTARPAPERFAADRSEPAVADLDKELEPSGDPGFEAVDEAEDLSDGLGASGSGYAARAAQAGADDAPAPAEAEASSGQDTRRRERAPKATSAPAPESASSGVPAAPPPNLEAAARPPGPLSAIALPVKRQLDEGDARGAVAAATTALQRADLDRTARADLHYVRGLASRALGRTADADADFRDAARLR